MSRLKLIKKLNKKTPELNKSEIEKVIDIFSESISNSLISGKNVEIRGFGRLYCKKLKENFNARNPSTNKLIYKPERVKIKFRSSNKLNKRINE